ncbi:MAG: hypothetical protein KGI52_03820 [Burkholderiales bacterium]|nr:hypothetical protein [Burkholderiales bacterium]
MTLNSRGEGAFWLTSGQAYKFVVYDALGNLLPCGGDNITGADASSLALAAQLASTTDISKGDALIGVKLSASNAISRTQHDKNAEIVSVKDFGAVGDGVTDDTAAIQYAINALNPRGTLFFPSASSNYMITNTLSFINKPGCVIDFNNQQINATGFSGTAKPAVYFKGVSEAVIKNIFLIGNTTYVSQGVFFDADANHISIHMDVQNIHCSSCSVGIQIGTDTYQVSDSYFNKIYGSDGIIGVYVTGANTLALSMGLVEAYNNKTRGVHIEAGGGIIQSLLVAASGSDLFFGTTSGNLNSNLARWDIRGGHSEEGVNGEIFINSVTTVDANPFTEQITISGFRCTPFTSTNVTDFIKWNLNGDLVLKNCDISHGQQMPRINIDNNPSYRNGRVIVDDCVISCGPTSSPQVAVGYQTTSYKQQVILSSQVNNGMSWWNNNGASGPGVIGRGIYQNKVKDFEGILLAQGSLVGSWNLQDAGNKNQVAKNLVLGGADLAVSALLEQRDLVLDDGLCGVLQNGGTTAKTLSSSNSVFSAGSWAFGAIVRAQANNTDPIDGLNIGGSIGIRIGVSVASGVGSATCRVGGVSTSVTVANPYDAHLVIACYTSAASVVVYAINLRTGAIVSVTNTTSIPASSSLTWVNGLNISTQLCVKGHIFCTQNIYTATQVGAIMAAAARLTNSWLLV